METFLALGASGPDFSAVYFSQRFRERFLEAWDPFLEAFGMVLATFLSRNPKMENCVWTAQVWADGMSRPPGKQPNLSFFSALGEMR